MRYEEKDFPIIIPVLIYNCYSCKRRPNCDNTGGVPECSDCKHVMNAEESPECSNCKGLFIITGTTHCNFEPMKKRGIRI